MANKRVSNIELCRIASVILIIILHSAAWTQADVSSTQTTHIPLLFLQSFSIIGVNVFVLISGYFGIKWKKKSLVNFFYIIAFYGILRCIVRYFQGNLVWQDLFIISSFIWFVIAYIGLLLLSPILNSFFDNSTKHTSGIVLLCVLFFQFWTSWFPGLAEYDSFLNGYSVLSFSVLYMLGRYIKLYSVPEFITKHSGKLYIIVSLIIGFAAYVSIVYNLPGYHLLYKYNSPLVILSSICFFLFFSKTDIGYKKWINYMAKSTLAVVCIHAPYPFRDLMKSGFGFLESLYSSNYAVLRMDWLLDNTLVMNIVHILIWLIAVFSVYMFCVCFDQIRILSYKLIEKRIKD